MNNFTLLETVKFDACSGMSKMFLLHSKNDYHIRLIYSPFSNCQTFIMSPFEYLFRAGVSPSRVNDLIRDAASLCKVNKHLCQVDIKQPLFKAIEPYIKVHAKMDYVNLTGSKMVNLLIHI